MSCKKILVVDDDPAVRDTIHAVLELQGYEPILASDGREAIDLLKQSGNSPCVILLDMMMPGMNGWQFLDLQRTNPDFQKIPIIVCSAFYESARSVNPSAFIPKPIELKSLLSTVKSFCA